MRGRVAYLLAGGEVLSLGVDAPEVILQHQTSHSQDYPLEACVCGLVIWLTYNVLRTPTNRARELAINQDSPKQKPSRGPSKLAFEKQCFDWLVLGKRALEGRERFG